MSEISGDSIVRDFVEWAVAQIALTVPAPFSYMARPRNLYFPTKAAWQVWYAQRTALEFPRLPFDKLYAGLHTQMWCRTTTVAYHRRMPCGWACVNISHLTLLGWDVALTPSAQSWHLLDYVLTMHHPETYEFNQRAVKSMTTIGLHGISLKRELPDQQQSAHTDMPYGNPGYTLS